METRYKQTGRRQTSRRGARDQKLVYVGEDLNESGYDVQRGPAKIPHVVVHEFYQPN